MSRTTSRTGFTPEMGRRLRALRKAAGLTQSAIAEKLGLGRRTGKASVSRLELGRLRHPTLDFIADYLKACGATFDAIAAELGVVPTVSAETAETQESKPRKPKPELTTEQKVAEVERKARRLYVRRMVEEALFELLSDKAAPQGFEQRKALAQYGRKVFSLLERRGKALGRIRKELLQVKGVDLRSIEAVDEVMEFVHKRLKESGDFERRMPIDAMAVVQGRARLGKVRLVEERLLKAEEEEFLALARERNRAIEWIKTEHLQMLVDGGMDRNKAARYNILVTEACGIASDSAPGSLARKRKRKEMVDRSKDKKQVRTLVDFAYKRWDELAEEGKTTPPKTPAKPHEKSEAQV
jgi:transcriptional regulator with XRE-family HTH domain